MTEVLSAERIDPSTLNKQQLEELSGKLFQIHRAIFTGLDEKGFDHYVLNSPATATSVFLYCNKEKELIGYFGVHRFETYVEERPLVVFRAKVVLLPEYRQKDANLFFWLKEAAKFKLLHPFKRVYFLYAPVSPSFYAMVARYTYKVYPRHDLSIPPRILKLMAHLAQQFGLDRRRKPVDTQGGLGNAGDGYGKNFWQSSQNPHVRFYIKNNPGFIVGHGLLTLIPLTITNTLLSLFGQAIHSIKKRLRYKM